MSLKIVNYKKVNMEISQISQVTLKKIITCMSINILIYHLKVTTCVFAMFILYILTGIYNHL